MPSQSSVAQRAKVSPSSLQMPRHAVFDSPPKSEDILAHRGRDFQLMDQPLERYFSMIGQRPCEAEYTAHWEIEDGWLYLTGLSCAQPFDKPMCMETMFPFAGRRVFAAWYTGQVRGFRTDRSSPATPHQRAVQNQQFNRYPDLVLNINCGRIETISLVHSSDRARAVSPLVMGVPAAAGSKMTGGTANVLAFVPKNADGNWNPGWQGALV